MAAFGTTIYYKAQLKSGAFAPSGTTYYDSMDKMWAALKDGTVDAAYVGETDAATWLKANSDYKVYHAAAGWSGGVAFGCSPRYGDIVQLLNDGLTKFKAKQAFADICAKYPSIACDTAGANIFSNRKIDAASPTATHPDGAADIVIGTEGDWGEYNFIKDGVLGGFDIELVEGVCAEINKKCAIVTVPWQSVWPKKYTPFGWDDNSKTYPGEGHNHDWFHCSVGTRNMIARQQSVAFTHGYTNKSKDTAGFASKLHTLCL